MKISKSDYRLFDKLNKRLAAWEKSGVEHSIITETKDSLLSFYDEEDIDISRMKSIRFKKSGDMTKEQIKQLRQIAKMMDAQKESKISFFKKNMDDMSRYEKSYETAKQRYGVQITDFPSYIKFIEKMNSLSQRLKEYYTSKQVVQILEYGLALGLSRSEVNKLMHNQARNKKTPDDERYDRTIAKIDKYYEKKMKDNE